MGGIVKRSNSEHGHSNAEKKKIGGQKRKEKMREYGVVETREENVSRRRESL